MNDIVGLVLFTVALGGVLVLGVLMFGLFAADVIITERHGLRGRSNSWLEGELGMGSRWPNGCRRGECRCSLAARPSAPRPGAEAAERLTRRLDAGEIKFR